MASGGESEHPEVGSTRMRHGSDPGAPGPVALENAAGLPCCGVPNRT
jgi:hypothetical protein